MTLDDFKVLCELEKHFADTNIYLPAPGNKLDSPLTVLSNTTRDVFSLDIDRHGITLTKKKLQERHCNSNTVMIRLEIDCRPHMYEDGHLSTRNHTHIFDAENGNITYDLDEKFAELFTNTNDFLTVFYDFCHMCNIETSNINVQGVM